MATGVGLNKAETEQPVRDMLTRGYKFPKQDADDVLKVNISEYVAFGDIKDASSVEPQNEDVGGTIISTVRKFFPGKYKVSVIYLYHNNDPLVMFHHERVDPNLLIMQVIRLSEDYSHFHRGLCNSINRYDWCHWTHFGESVENEDAEAQANPQLKSAYSKANAAVMSLLQGEFEGDVAPTVPLPNEGNDYFNTFIYFTKTEKAEQLRSFILKNQIRRSPTIKYLFSVQDDEGETVSLGVYFTPFNKGEWEYAKAFEDSATSSYFALVVNGHLDLSVEPWKEMYDEEERKNLNFTTVDKTKLRFPITEFMINDKSI